VVVDPPTRRALDPREVDLILGFKRRTLEENTGGSGPSHREDCSRRAIGGPQEEEEEERYK
jgi:hypothetical protein